MAATLDSLTPVPAVGFPEARSGGQLVAQAPKHALLRPESSLKRYSVRPREATRMCPRLLVAPSTGALGSPEVLAEFDEVLDPPPQAASETAPSATAATEMEDEIRLVRCMV